MRILTGAAGLLAVGVFVLNRLGDGLAIGHLGHADIGVDLELPAHAVDQDFEMQLAHALDHGLPALGIERYAEARILLGEAAERGGHLFLVGLGLGLDRDLDHRVGELDPLQHHRVARIGQGLAGGGVLEPGQSDDVAGLGLA